MKNNDNEILIGKISGYLKEIGTLHAQNEDLTLKKSELEKELKAQKDIRRTLEKEKEQLHQELKFLREKQQPGIKTGS